jgi:hypothetical protein
VDATGGVPAAIGNFTGRTANGASQPSTRIRKNETPIPNPDWTSGVVRRNSGCFDTSILKGRPMNDEKDRLAVLMTSGTAQDIEEYADEIDAKHKALLKELRCFARIRKATETPEKVTA